MRKRIQSRERSIRYIPDVVSPDAQGAPLYRVMKGYFKLRVTPHHKYSPAQDEWSTCCGHCYPASSVFLRGGLIEKPLCCWASVAENECTAMAV